MSAPPPGAQPAAGACAPIAQIAEQHLLSVADAIGMAARARRIDDEHAAICGVLTAISIISAYCVARAFVVRSM